MGHGSAKRQLTGVLAGALVSTLVITTAAPVAMAQNSTTRISQDIQIPAGPLGDALLALSVAYDRNIIVDEPLVAGKRAPAVSGALSIEDALARVLAGSGLVAKASNTGAFIIAQQTSQAVPQKKPIGDRPTELIIVKGEKFERTLQETVTSVAVYNEKVIDNQNFVDLFDLINQTANVAGLGNDAGFTIRGLRNTGAAAANISDTATVYLDGVFIPSRVFATSPLNLWDVQSVEIFRGPQSTIQGRNALIGAVVARSVD
ncbi:MAG: TonB-dependent receptor plug domain-containing protein, partial [Pseudomonadota bacterium]